MTKLMAITAHPQDLVERTGGTVAKHIERGDEVMWVNLTSGAVTHAFNMFPAEGEDKLKDMEKIKEMKREELERAANILGVQHWHFLDFPENPMTLGFDEYKTVIELMRSFRPDIVITQHPMEYGRFDHMDAGEFAIRCVDYVRADGFDSPLAPHSVSEVYFAYYLDSRSDVLMATPRHAPDVVVDITDVAEKKKAAMAEFATTQTKPGEDFSAKMDVFMASIDGAVGYVNGFGYGEQFVRFNPSKVQYLPAG